MVIVELMNAYVASY